MYSPRYFVAVADFILTRSQEPYAHAGRVVGLRWAYFDVERSDMLNFSPASAFTIFRQGNIAGSNSSESSHSARLRGSCESEDSISQEDVLAVSFAFCTAARTFRSLLRCVQQTWSTSNRPPNSSPGCSSSRSLSRSPM
jgi:hypothetical protein